VAAALTGAAEASARDGWLLIRRAVETRQSTSRGSDLSWLPVTSPEDLHRHPLLAELRATRDALAAGRPALDRALAAVAPPAPDTAVRWAALAAGRAGAELRAALNSRRGLPPSRTCRHIRCCVPSRRPSCTARGSDGEQRRRAWHWRRQYYPSLSGPLQGQGAPLEGRPAGGRSLTEAQRRIATDWTTAFR
jgi:hypothetical protein